MSGDHAATDLPVLPGSRDGPRRRDALSRPILELLRRAGPVGRIAVAPVDGPGVAALKRDELRRQIEAALVDNAGPGQQIISRSALSAVFEEALEFGGARLNDLLAAGEADALVVAVLESRSAGTA